MTSATHRGFSLVELVVVLTLLSLSAVILIPAVQPTQGYRLDLAASEFADAMRFARSEALRTGKPHGFLAESSENRIRVFRANTITTPLTPVHDVYHPVSRRLYDLDLDTEDALAGVTMNSGGPTWLGTCDTPDIVVFDATGTPHCSDPWTVLLAERVVTLAFTDATRQVVLAGETGRVVVQ